MYGETLPEWFWVLYYLFFLTTIGTALFQVLRKKMKGLSVFAIFIAAAVPIVSLIESIGRAEGMNEYEHFLDQLQQGAIWPIYALTGYLFLFLWWGLFLFKRNKKNRAASH